MLFKHQLGIPEYGLVMLLLMATLFSASGGAQGQTSLDHYLGPADIPRLLEALHHPEARVRTQALTDLSRVIPVQKEIILAFVKAMNSPDARTRTVAKQLWDQSVQVQIPWRIVLALTDDLTRGPFEARVEAAEALAEIRSDALEVLGALEKALTDEHDEVRYRAAVAIGAIGPEAKRAVPALTAALMDTAPGVRERAAEALGRLHGNGREAVPALVSVLTDSDPAVRRASAEALGQIGWPARSAIPALVHALSDAEFEVRGAAAYAVGYIQSRRDPRRTAILDRSVAQRSQVDLDPTLQDTIAALVARRADGSGYVRANVIAAVGLIGATGVNVTSELMPALKDPDPRVRAIGASSLGRMGPGARGALAALQQALQDEDTMVRAEAANALDRIK